MFLGFEFESEIKGLDFENKRESTYFMFKGQTRVKRPKSNSPQVKKLKLLQKLYLGMSCQYHEDYPLCHTNITKGSFHYTRKT